MLFQNISQAAIATPEVWDRAEFIGFIPILFGLDNLRSIFPDPRFAPCNIWPLPGNALSNTFRRTARHGAIIEELSFNNRVRSNYRTISNDAAAVYLCRIGNPRSEERRVGQEC